MPKNKISLDEHDENIDSDNNKEHNTQKEFSLSLLLKTFSATLLLAFVIVALFLAYKVSTNVHWVKDELSFTKYPIKGESVIIKEFSSYWEFKDKPEKVDEPADLIFYPRAVVKIHKKSGNGTIRCFFQDSDGKFTGDPFTESFKDGAFSTGDTFEFKSSTGIESRSDYNAYFAGFSKPWHFIIMEGDADSKTISQFKELARIELRPILKEQ